MAYGGRYNIDAKDTVIGKVSVECGMSGRKYVWDRKICLPRFKERVC